MKLFYSSWGLLYLFWKVNENLSNLAIKLPNHVTINSDTGFQTNNVTQIVMKRKQIDQKVTHLRIVCTGHVSKTCSQNGIFLNSFTKGVVLTPCLLDLLQPTSEKIYVVDTTG